MKSSIRSFTTVVAIADGVDPSSLEDEEVDGGKVGAGVIVVVVG